VRNRPVTQSKMINETRKTDFKIKNLCCVLLTSEVSRGSMNESCSIEAPAQVSISRHEMVVRSHVHDPGVLGMYRFRKLCKCMCMNKIYCIIVYKSIYIHFALLT
jgi:hypothetical protein